MFNGEESEEENCRQVVTPIRNGLNLNLNGIQTNGHQNSTLSPVFSKRQNLQLQHNPTNRHNPSCLFCKFATGAIRTSALSTNPGSFLINDAFPKAPIHQLWMPFEHIRDISDMQLDSETDASLAIEFFTALKDFSDTQRSFTVYGNNGTFAGQTIPHLHFHITSGGNVLGNGKSKRLLKNEIGAASMLLFGDSEKVICSSKCVRIVAAPDNVLISKNGSPRNDGVDNCNQNSSSSFSALSFEGESMNSLFETEMRPSHYIIIPVNPGTCDPLIKTISEFDKTNREHRMAAVSLFDSIQRLSLDLGVEGFNIVILYDEPSQMFCLHFISGKNIHEQ